MAYLKGRCRTLVRSVVVFDSTSRGLCAGLALIAISLSAAATAFPAKQMQSWQDEFPLTDFDRRSIQLDEIVDDGNTRDSIPPIGDPKFVAASEVEDIGDLEPVLSVEIDGDRRAYPIRILLWHEIVNDVVGGVPVLVSYCPLCNSGVVFDRRVAARILTFGNTGRIRHYDMVMYDHNTESWWQQFLGEAIVGRMAGARMTALPARLESLKRFRARAPDGRVLVPNDPEARPYGMTPFAGMSSSRISASRFPYPLPDGVLPLDRVVVVGREAWTLESLRTRKRVEVGDLTLLWEPGQNSIHDTRMIAKGRDVGNVVVKRQTDDGLVNVPYDVTFAFAFSAFVPDGSLHTE
jgi:hypothetical protein